MLSSLVQQFITIHHKNDDSSKFFPTPILVGLCRCNKTCKSSFISRFSSQGRDVVIIISSHGCILLLADASHQIAANGELKRKSRKTEKKFDFFFFLV